MLHELSRIEIKKLFELNNKYVKPVERKLLKVIF